MKSRVLVRNDPARFVATTSLLSKYQVVNVIPLIDVIKTLNEHKVRFILVGAHGISAWTKSPRATEDVDVIVATRHQKKAVRVLSDSFPHLEAEDHEVMVRLKNNATMNVAIDIMNTNLPIYQAALRNTKSLKIEMQRCRIPTLEMSLAMKFARMVSMARAYEKKYLDAHDFILMTKANPDINLAKLQDLGDLVYPGGGKEILEKVRQVRAGEKLVL